MRVVIADDSALIRDGLAQLLPARGYDVVGAVADAAALLDAVDLTRPQVALIDIRMPPTFTNERIEAATAIQRSYPDVGVLVLSQHVEAEYALALINGRPARSGYLLKDCITNIATLTDAIDRVGRGETMIEPQLVDLLLQRPRTRSRLADLTDREREVLSLLAEGLTDRGIAERLWLTPKTVETHVRHILLKLSLPADAGYNRRVLAVLTYLRQDRS